MAEQQNIDISNKRKVSIISLIVLSYVLTYFAPIIMMYFALRKSFVTEYITKQKYTLSFLGFVTVSTVLIIVLLIKFTIKLIKSKPSIFKFIMTYTLNLLALLFFVMVLVKARDITFMIQDNSIVFFDSLRHFLVISRNYIFVFIGLITLSSIARITAVGLSKEYVRSLDWL